MAIRTIKPFSAAWCSNCCLNIENMFTHFLTFLNLFNYIQVKYNAYLYLCQPNKKQIITFHIHYSIIQCFNFKFMIQKVYKQQIKIKMGNQPLSPTSKFRNKDLATNIIQQYSKQKKQNTLIKRDPRLIQKNIFQPQLFIGQIDVQVKKIQRLIQLMPYHILESQIVDGLNQRFSKSYHIKIPIKKVVPQKVQNNGMQQTNKKDYQVKINGMGNNTPKQFVNQSINEILSKQIKSQSSPKKAQKLQNKNSIQQKMQQKQLNQFYQLQTQQRFLQLLRKLQHQYYIQKQLNIGLAQRKSDKKITIRKKIIPEYETKLNRLLFSKLYLIFYLKILKFNFNTKDKSRNTLVVQFHNSIGKMICDMIEHNHFADKKLIHLAYKMIYIEKKGAKKDLQIFLGEIRKQFWPFYLTKQHNLTLKPQQYNRIRQISRCYLDQLYLRSLKQAQDPDIIVDANQGFGILKNFPILKVRQDKNS